MIELRSARGPALVFLLQICSILSPMQFVVFSLSQPPALECRSAQIFHIATASAGSRQSSFFVSMVQIARAILFAKAIAINMLGLLSGIRASHEPSGFAFQQGSDAGPGLGVSLRRTSRHRCGANDQQSAKVPISYLGHPSQSLLASR